MVGILGRPVCFAGRVAAGGRAGQRLGWGSGLREDGGLGGTARLPQAFGGRGKTAWYAFCLSNRFLYPADLIKISFIISVFFGKLTYFYLGFGLWHTSEMSVRTGFVGE